VELAAVLYTPHLWYSVPSSSVYLFM
jgi:hypothetical protein